MGKMWRKWIRTRSRRKRKIKYVKMNRGRSGRIADEGV